jgi:hypothetical protein
MKFLKAKPTIITIAAVAALTGGAYASTFTSNTKTYNSPPPKTTAQAAKAKKPAPAPAPAPAAVQTAPVAVTAPITTLLDVAGSNGNFCTIEGSLGVANQNVCFPKGVDLPVFTPTVAYVINIVYTLGKSTINGSENSSAEGFSITGRPDIGVGSPAASNDPAVNWSGQLILSKGQSELHSSLSISINAYLGEPLYFVISGVSSYHVTVTEGQNALYPLQAFSILTS